MEINNFKSDNVGEILRIQEEEERFKTLMLISEVDKIRQRTGAFIWIYPIKWRDANKVTTKIMYGWEIELESGECKDYPFNFPNAEYFNTYLEAVENAIKWHNELPAPPKD